MSDFYNDRDSRGRPAEYLIVEYFRSRGIPAEVNDAPEEDYAGRAAYDVVIGDEAWDVKTDWIAATSKRIFVELASLEHTRSSRFAYVIPTPYGFDIRIFTITQLMNYYKAVLPVRRADGSFFQMYKYLHGAAGDQAENMGVFVPLEVVKAEGMAPWQVAKVLKQAA